MAPEPKVKNTTLHKTHNSESQKRKSTRDDGPHDIPPPSKKQKLDDKDHQPVRRSKRNMPSASAAKNTTLNNTHNSESQKRKDRPYESPHGILPSKKQKLENKDEKLPRPSNRDNAAPKDQNSVQDKKVPHIQEESNHDNIRISKNPDSASAQDKEHTSNSSGTGRVENTQNAKQPEDQASEGLESREEIDAEGLLELKPKSQSQIPKSLEPVQKRNTRSNANAEPKAVRTEMTTKPKEKASDHEPSKALGSKNTELAESSRLEGKPRFNIPETSDDYGLASELRATSRSIFGEASPEDVHEILRHIKTTYEIQNFKLQDIEKKYALATEENNFMREERDSLQKDVKLNKRQLQDEIAALRKEKARDKERRPRLHEWFRIAGMPENALTVEALTKWVKLNFGQTLTYGGDLGGYPYPAEFDDQIPETTALNSDLIRWFCQFTCLAEYSREEMIQRTRRHRHKIVGTTIIAAIIEKIFNNKQFPPTELFVAFEALTGLLDPLKKHQSDPQELVDDMADLRRSVGCAVLEKLDYYKDIISSHTREFTQSLRVTMQPLLFNQDKKKVDTLFTFVERVVGEAYNIHLRNRLNRVEAIMYWPTENATEHVKYVDPKDVAGRKICFVERPPIKPIVPIEDLKIYDQGECHFGPEPKQTLNNVSMTEEGHRKEKDKNQSKTALESPDNQSEGQDDDRRKEKKSDAVEVPTELPNRLEQSARTKIIKLRYNPQKRILDSTQPTDTSSQPKAETKEIGGGKTARAGKVKRKKSGDDNDEYVDDGIARKKPRTANTVGKKSTADTKRRELKPRKAKAKAKKDDGDDEWQEGQD